MRRSLSMPVAALAFLVCVAFSVVGGALVVHGSSDQGSHVTVGGRRIALTKQESQGHMVFAVRCGACHQLAASRTIGEVGPNLDYVSPTIAQVENIIQNGQVGAYGDMPSGLTTGPNVAAVAAYVHKVANRKYYSP